MNKGTLARFWLRTTMVLAVAFIYLAGSPGLQPALAQDPVEEPVVEPGPVDFSDEVASASLRDLFSGAGAELFLGIPDLGGTTGGAAPSFVFETSNNLSFVFDPSADTLTITLSNTVSNASITLADFSAQLAAAGYTLDDIALNALQLSVVMGPGGDPGFVSIQDLMLNGVALGDLAANPDEAGQDWGVTGIDLSQGFVLQARLVFTISDDIAYPDAGIDLTIGTASPDPDAPPTANIVNVTPDPRATGVATIVVAFNKPVVGVDLADFALTLNDTPVDLSGATLSGSGAEYSLSGLAALTAAGGAYELTLSAAGSGITDVAGQGLDGDASDAWTTDPALLLAEFEAITPEARTEAVTSVSVTFNRAVTGLDLADLSLVRNGAPVDLSGATLSGADASYVIEGLSAATAPEGGYGLTITAAGSGISDASGTALSADATVFWSVDRTAPTADIVDVDPDPRTTRVRSVKVVFSEPVTGVDLSDFWLQYNGTPIPLIGPGGVTLSGGGDTYLISGLGPRNLFAGDYTLQLRAGLSGIADTTGNGLAGDASDSWQRLPRLVLWQQTCVMPADGGAWVATYTVVNNNSQAVTIPVGADNYISPSPDDQGQPTTFEPGETIVNLTFDGPTISWTLNDLVETIFAANVCDTTPPTATIAEVTPDPRTTGVASIAIEFSEPVEGFDLADMHLTRSGQSVDLSAATLNGSDASYTLDGLAALTEPIGAYELTLKADGSAIADLDENQMAVDASESWERVNVAPTATNDSYTVAEDKVLRVNATGVLGNDSDPDGQSLTALLVTPPAHGELTLNANGSFVYTPAANYFGADSFTYQAGDGIDSSTPATVAIEVTGVNDAPSYTPGDNIVSYEDQAYSAGWATEMSAGPNEGDQALTFAVSTTNGKLFAVAPAIDADGNLSFTPAPNRNGAATVTVRLRDDGGTANRGVDRASLVARFTITVLAVNDAPIVKAARAVVYGKEDFGFTRLAWLSVLRNGPSDELYDDISTKLLENTNPGLFTGEPRLAKWTGDVEYVTRPDVYGEATLTFAFMDDGGTANGGTDTTVMSITVVVRPVNDYPIANDDAYTTRVNTTLSVAAPQGVLANDYDVDGGAPRLVLINRPPGVRINDDGSFTFTPAKGFTGAFVWYYKYYDRMGGEDTSKVIVRVTR